MNLRQKNKKLKRELEYYKKRMINPAVISEYNSYDIRTFVMERVVREEELEFFNKDDLVDILSRDLLDRIQDIVEVSNIGRTAYGVRYRAELKVAVPKNKFSI